MKECSVILEQAAQVAGFIVVSLILSAIFHKALIELSEYFESVRGQYEKFKLISVGVATTAVLFVVLSFNLVAKVETKNGVAFYKDKKVQPCDEKVAKGDRSSKILLNVLISKNNRDIQYAFQEPWSKICV